MAFLQDVSIEELQEAIQVLAEHNLALALTARYQNRWVTFRTHAVAHHKDVVWVETPKTDHLPENYKFQPGERIGVTFSAAHRKYVFATQLIRLEKYELESGAEATALKLRCAGEMHRVERRLHERLDASSGEVTRATFWLGGCDAKPPESNADAPVWAGRILNMSTGGMLLRSSYEAAKYVEIGDIVGMHILLGNDEPAAFVDAQLRHCARDGEMALMGLQFVEMPQSEEAGAGLQLLREKIEELRKQEV